MFCASGFQLKTEIRLVVMWRGGAGTHAHDDQPQKLDHLVNFFEVTPKIAFAYTCMTLLNNY